MEQHRDASRDQQTARGNGGARGAPGEWLQHVCIPDHQLLRCIGRGSYGEVWLARNRIGGYRAVKIVHREAFDHDRPFERELSGLHRFKPISRSQEGLIGVLDIGINEQQGYFYCVMELGDDQTSGQSLDPENYSPKTLAKEIALHGKLPFQPCLQLGLALSLALVQLHKHGLVHRDVKPSNIIFVKGVPKLADIGLVADADAARSYVGTEGFIPPEGPGTPQADIYSLGKVLYEASTGKDRQEFPELPTRLDRFSDYELFLELNEVIVRACRNDPHERYPSAWDLYTDLLMLANGESIKRLNSRDKRMANLKRVGAVSILVLLGALIAAQQVHHECRAAMESRQRQVDANVAYGNRAMESGDLLGSLPYYAEALHLDRGDLNLERQYRLQIGSALSQCAKLEQLWFSPKEIAQACFSPDGQRVLITERGGRTRSFEVATGKPLEWSIDQGQLYGAEYSPDGNRVVTASGDRTAGVWNAGDGSRVFKLEHPDQVFSARFSPDGLRLVTACNDNKARIWEARTGRLNLVLAGHTEAVLFASFSHNGRLIVTAGRDRTARLWDATDGRPLGPALPHANWVTCAAFSPDDQEVVTGCYDYKARVWAVPTGRKLLPELDHHDGILAAEFSPDGRWILTASVAGTARLWRADNLLPLSCSPVPSQRVTHACFGPEGRRIISICSDGTARIWNLAGTSVSPAPTRGLLCEDGSRFLALTSNGITVFDAVSGKPLCPIITAKGPVLKTGFNRNGRFVLGACETAMGLTKTNCLLQVWNTMTGKATGPGILLSNSFAGASLNDDGERLVTFAGRLAQCWDVPKGAALGPPIIHADTVIMACFSPDGTRVLIAGGNQVQMLKADSGEAVFPALQHPVPVVHAEFSRDGSRLVTCCANDDLAKCSAQVWNTATGQPVGVPLRHNDGVLFASFSPDGRRVVTASEDFTAIVWDTATGQQLTPPPLHEHQVRSARFSPDGKWIVTASADKTARVWSAGTGDPLTPPLRHITRLSDARFLADGRRIFTSDPQGHCWIWPLPIDERPVEDLQMFGQLLSSRNVALPGQLPPPHPEMLPALWQQLRNKYPSSFTVSAQEIEAWHEFQAWESEAELQWFAAAFHLERLLALRPGDAAIMERLNAAKANLLKREGTEVAGVSNNE
jgi:WD40 repeat protein